MAAAVAAWSLLVAAAVAGVWRNKEEYWDWSLEAAAGEAVYEAARSCTDRWYGELALA